MSNNKSNNKVNKNSIALIIGILLVVFGLWQLAERFFGTFFGEIWRFISLGISILWPLAIIAGGILLMLAARRGKLDLSKDTKLFRSSRSKKLGGVCGGIAEYLNIDPAMVRVITIVLAILCWYIIVPLYILFWIIIPYNPNNYNTWV